MHQFHQEFAERYIIVKYRSSLILVNISQSLLELWPFFLLSFYCCVDIGFCSLTLQGMRQLYWKFAEQYIIINYRGSLILVILLKILAGL